MEEERKKNPWLWKRRKNKEQQGEQQTLISDKK